MQNVIRKALLCALVVTATCAGANEQVSQSTPRAVDLVIALDVSGSMSGLIDSAKQRLWDVVNELERAQPQPDLRVAILSYGNPSYGMDSGYVRIDQPLTRDLDAVSQRLFSFTTSGGDEYVARTVHRALDSLRWSDRPNAMRLMFVAGNESAAQDPQFALEDVLAAAAQAGVVVNAIYCGGDGDGDAASWRRVAAMGLGTYASINQHTDAVVHIETPMDAKLAKLNQALNETYVAYGNEGEQGRANQIAQDENATETSMWAAASRIIAKAGALYRSAKWDLVDAFESGKDVKEVKEQDLPAVMQPMSPEEREEYVAGQSKRRAELKGEIAAVAEERRDYIAEHEPSEADDGLDAALVGGVKKVAEAQGFTFE